MATDKPSISTERKPDPKPKSEGIVVAEGWLIVVEGNKSFYVGKERTEITKGVIIRNKANHRTEVTANTHVIFEPLSRGPIPEEIVKRPRFQEVLGGNLIEV